MAMATWARLRDRRCHLAQRVAVAQQKSLLAILLGAWTLAAASVHGRLALVHRRDAWARFHDACFIFIQSELIFNIYFRQETFGLVACWHLSQGWTKKSIIWLWALLILYLVIIGIVKEKLICIVNLVLLIWMTLKMRRIYRHLHRYLFNGGQNIIAWSGLNRNEFRHRGASRRVIIDKPILSYRGLLVHPRQFLPKTFKLNIELFTSNGLIMLSTRSIWNCRASWKGLSNMRSRRSYQLGAPI